MTAGGNEHDDRQLDEALARTLRERADQVPPEIAERLAEMRRSAVAEADARTSRRNRRTSRPSRPLLVLGGLAGAAAAVGLTVAILLQRAGEPDPAGLLLADADELAAMAEMDVLEDLEFLAWLEQEQLDDGQS